MKRLRRSERGAIVVEASISFTVFIFTMFIIYSIIDICFIQSKIGTSLNYAAQDLSEYSYLYYAFGVDDHLSNLHNDAGTQAARADADSTMQGLGMLMDGLEGVEGSTNPSNLSINLDDLNSSIDNINNGASVLSGTVDSMADRMADDPRGFIFGMGKLAGDELGANASSLLGQSMGKAFMKKNLVDVTNTDADTFLKRYHVVGGLSGLNFAGTQMMSYGTSNDIMLVCDYYVEVVKLLNTDIKLHFKQCALTKAWGNGVSSGTSPSQPNAPPANNTAGTQPTGPTDIAQLPGFNQNPSSTNGIVSNPDNESDDANNDDSVADDSGGGNPEADPSGANSEGGLNTPYQAPKITTNSRGELTNGNFVLDAEGMIKHTDGTVGKSQFLYDVDANKAVLDAAAYADEYNLWGPSSGNPLDFADKAKVFVENGPVGITGSGELTNYINIYRTKTGYVHGCPGNP